MRAQDLLNGATELVLGARCAGCGAAGLGPCPSCAQLVRSGRPLAVRELILGDLVVVASAPYEAVLKSLLVAAKERGSLGSLPLLGERLAVAVAALALAAQGECLVLVPVPSAGSVVAQRGLDFTASLAWAAASRLRAGGIEVVVSRGLRQVRRPADQAGLSHDQRLANLRGALASRRLPAGEVIVVDDIVTTGASLAEAARVLKQVNRNPLGAATVAATIRRRS